jgi:hypothetical protein
VDKAWARSVKEKENTFVGYLEKIFKPNELPQNEDHETEINKAWKEPLQMTHPVNSLHRRKFKT